MNSAKVAVGLLITSAILLIIAFFSYVTITLGFNNPSSDPPTGTGAIAADANNNVGISVSAPAARLEIEDGGTANARLVKITQDDDTVKGLIVGNDTYSPLDDNGLGLWVDNAGTAFIRGGVSTAKNLRLNDNGGFVVVGTGVAPVGPFEINSGAGDIFMINETTNGAIFEVFMDGFASIGTYTAHELRFMTDYIDRTVMTSGNNDYQGVNNDWKFGIGANPAGRDARVVICRRGTANEVCIVPAASPTVLELGSHNNLAGGSSIRAKGTISGGLADIGEYVKVEGEALSYEAGDILAISDSVIASSDAPGGARQSHSYGLFKKSAQPYDSKVAGIVTETAGLIAGGGDETITFNESGKSTNRVIMALAGQVPAKATAENGPIAIGDLLTTASTPGHLMKCPIDTAEQKLKCMGTIVAKALESLEGGSDKIMVLITLQ